MQIVRWRMRLARFLEVFAVSCLFFALAVSGALSDELGSDPTASSGWAFEVFVSDLYRVDNIVLGPRGEMYATIESQSQGRVVRLSGGGQLTLATGLHRPDGLAIRPPYLYVTEEVDGGRIMRIGLTDLSISELARLRGPEGIDFLPDGSLVVAEDHGGRVLRVTEDGASEILIDGLRAPEGVAVSPEGEVYVAETGTGRILRIANGSMETVIEGLNHPDQVEFASDGALWITEDAKPGRLLRYVSGRLEVTVAGLMSPQGIAFGGDGEVYVAEQKRNRILVLRSTASD